LTVPSPANSNIPVWPGDPAKLSRQGPSQATTLLARCHPCKPPVPSRTTPAHDSRHRRAIDAMNRVGTARNRAGDSLGRSCRRLRGENPGRGSPRQAVPSCPGLVTIPTTPVAAADESCSAASTHHRRHEGGGCDGRQHGRRMVAALRPARQTTDWPNRQPRGDSPGHGEPSDGDWPKGRPSESGDGSRHKTSTDANPTAPSTPEAGCVQRPIRQHGRRMMAIDRAGPSDGRRAIDAGDRAAPPVSANMAAGTIDARRHCHLGIERLHSKNGPRRCPSRARPSRTTGRQRVLPP
jgi:hypothetical protein